MQSSDAMKSILQDRHLLDRPYTATSYTAKLKTRGTRTRPRPVSAPPSQPPWRNPNATDQKKSKKFHVSLHHTPAESRVSKKAPFAPRTFLGAPSLTQAGVFTPTVYNSLSDPHLNLYFSRKFGQTPLLRISGVSKPQKRRSTCGMSKKKSGISYHVVVKTGNKQNNGTDAKIFLEFRGVNGRFRKQLVHQLEGDVPSAYIATLPPFMFTPGSKETFVVRGPDVGDLLQLNVEHDGRLKKQGWFLQEIVVTNQKTLQTWHFPCHQWLSAFESDCRTTRSLKPKPQQKAEKIVYVIDVETADKPGAGTDAHVFLTMFGKRGKTPKIQLVNRQIDTFERGKSDIFKLKTSSVGQLTKLIVEHDNAGFSPGWYLKKITVYRRDRPDQKWYFPCNQWLAKDENDGLIVRQLTARNNASATFEGFVYHVSTYTGDKRGAGTDANVVITIFGEEGDSGEHTLNNSRNNFARGKKDTFKVLCGSFLGKLKKVRISHDSSGLAPGWYLNKVTVEDLKSEEVADFPCRRWLAKDEDDGLTSRELLRADLTNEEREQMQVDSGIPYHLHVTTGDVRNASTNARVYVIMHGGEEGEISSGKLWLMNGKEGNFQRGRTNIFTVETADMLSPLHHLTVGHDNGGLGAGWFLEKVVVDCPSSGEQQVFLCQKWLADDEGDYLVERDLYETEDMRQKRKPKSVWNTWVWTSDIRGAGTDSNVFMVLYGNKGKTDVVPLENKSDNFEQGELDKFKLEMASIGKPYKLRIWHDDSKPFSDWHLNKIEMEHQTTKEKFSFKCDRWLSKSEDDHQIIRELPAFGKGISPIRVVIYNVFVHTGNKRGAGTNANVFICIFGELGDTGERPLVESKTNTNKFERNKVDEFHVEAVSLKNLKKLRIGHDSRGSSAGWFLDKVTVQDPQDGNKKYEFPCNRWLASDEDDGLTVRELSLGEASLLNSTSYHLWVKTGNVRGASTDANVFVQLFGSSGETGKVPLRIAENTKNKFERGRTDKFKVEVVDIGKIESLRIGHDNSGVGSAWFLADVTVDTPSRGERVVFPCHRWLATDEDDGKIERELFPGNFSQYKQKTPFEVAITTGDVRGAGTNANVFLVLYGENGKSDEFRLRDKSDNFERGQIDKFKVESEDIGKLTKIRIGHDDTGFRSAWFLEKVEICCVESKEEGRNNKKRQKSRDSAEWPRDEDDHTYLFVCKRWFARGEDDGQIVRELVPTDASGNQLKRNSLHDNTYRVHVITGDEAGAGTNANVFLTIYGEYGDTGERKLDKSETHINKFERNNEDIFEVASVTLGNLEKIKIRHDNTGLKSAWFLDRVEIKDKVEEKVTVFPCSRWLATNEEDGQICRELVPVDSRKLALQRKRSLSRSGSVKSLVDGVDLETKGRITTYECSVVTGDVRGAGTDANVFIVLYGEQGDTGKIQLKTSQTNKNKFERGQTDLFFLDALVGKVSKIRILHDNKGGFAGWYLDRVEINVPSLGQKAVFPCGRWLDKDKDDGQLERELFPVEETQQHYKPHVPYEITVYTSDLSSAGTSANVFIALYGVDGNTEEIVLHDTKLGKKKECFRRGSVDQFVKELENVGDLEKIRIGHDSKGMMSGWHLEKVEIRRLLEDGESSTLYTFPCRRWMAKGEGDGATVRELVPQKVVEEIVTSDGEVETTEVAGDTLDVRKYKVQVFTGDVKNAGTDAKVFLTLLGDLGDTGERQLTKSETHSNKFERGNEDVFIIEAVDLGNVYKAKVRHDNSMINPSWFLDRIVVKDAEAGRTYEFICERWLSKKKEDRKIERTLYAKGYEGDRSTIGASSLRSLEAGVDDGSPRMSHCSSRSSLRRSQDTITVASRSATADAVFEQEFGAGKEVETQRKTIAYTVRVATGDQEDAGSKARAYVVLIGTEAASEKIYLELFQKEGFTPGLTETFSVEAVDVGNVMKLEIGHSGYEADSGWFVKEVEVDVPTSGKKYFFPCNRWLAKDKEDGKVVRLLTGSDSQLVTYKPHVAYEVTVYTGDIQSAGTDSKVSMIVFGTQGTTTEKVLEKDEFHFERSSIDVFKMDLEDVGRLLKIRIGHDGTGNRPKWFLEKVVMHNLESQAVSLFKCNQWLSKTEGDGKLSVEIPAETDGEKALSETTYKVTVATSDIRGAGTDANVSVVIFGEYGDSGEVALKHSETYKDKFERDHQDVFYLKRVLSLGDLTKIRIWHDNKFIGASWHLASVDIVDQATDKSYSFPCNRWLAKDKEDGSLVRELTCIETKLNGETKSDSGVYEVTFITSDKHNAGTTQNAWIVFEGTDGKSKEYLIENSVKNKVMRRGMTNTFRFFVKPVGRLTYITVGHSKRDGGPVTGRGVETGWFLHEVRVESVETKEKYTFPCRQWISLSTGKNNSVRLECKSSEKPLKDSVRDLQPVQYQVDVYTADVKHAGTDANVFITIYGSNGDTGRRPLTKKFTDLFERGKRDDFKLEALDLGALLRLRIEHDNKGLGAGWMLDKIVITNTASQEVTTFPCNQWLDKKQGDSKISRDLFPLQK